MPAIQLTEDAREVLLAYPWPGNVRQLKNITEQISIIETNRKLTLLFSCKGIFRCRNTQRLLLLFGIKDSKNFSRASVRFFILFCLICDRKYRIEEDGT